MGPLPICWKDVITADGSRTCIGFWGFVILVVTAILWAFTASKLGRRCYGSIKRSRCASFSWKTTR